MTKTQVTFVLDSSGSMSAIKDDTIGGFNEFLEEQRDGEGTVEVTLFEFSDNVDTVYQGYPIVEAPELDEDTYTPSGQTALHDAIATAIESTSDRLEKTNPGKRPDSVIVVVLTDGKENASETPQETVRELVETHQDERDWEFLFIGANQDAALTASQVGIDADRSLDMDHSGEGTKAAYESTSRRISEARQEGTTGSFDERDRKRQEDAGE